MKSNLSIGIVGFPNVGKSTLFNAVLKKQVALSANYPFATIDPNVGITEVPDPRLSVLADIVGTTTIKPATIELVDIAGLVTGAHQGEGLGNKFLAHIREVTVIAHVLRDFSDSNVIREGTVSPREDLENIRTELRLADLTTLEKQKKPKTNDKEELKRWQIIETFMKRINQGQNVINTLDREKVPALEAQIASELCLLSAKQEIFVINVDEADLKRSQKLIEKWCQHLDVSQDRVVIVSAKVESELSTLSPEEEELFLEELGVEHSGLERLAKVAYQALNLQSFLTAGEKEVRAWTIVRGSTAREAAGVIHSDFEKNFIKAKVVNYDDFVAYDGWLGAKNKGKVRLEGKDYVMQEDDIVEFMIGK